jgi:hypothetical protein
VGVAVQQFDRSCQANIILPASTVTLMRERALEYWGAHAGAGGRDNLFVWSAAPGGDTRPIGAFGVAWESPNRCEATITGLAWDGRRADADDVRRAINYLAGWPVAWQEVTTAA